MRKPVSIAALGFLLVGAAVCAWAGESLQDAYRLMAHGEYEEALKQLDAALTAVPGNPLEVTQEQEELQAEALYLIGRSNEALGDDEAALRAYDVVTASFEDSAVYANTCLALAQLRIRRNEPEEAATQLGKALERGLSADHEFRAKLYLAEALSVPGTRVQNVDQAIELFTKLDETARKHVDLARISYGLGFCYQQKQDWEHAEERYVAASQVAPNSLWSAYARLQRLAYYRNQQLAQEVTLLQNQLRQQRVEIKQLFDGGPIAPKLPDADALEPKKGGGLVQEIRLPANAVFTHNGYTVKAQQFLIRQSERTLVGRDNVLLQYHGQQDDSIQVHARNVTIDLRKRNATFSGNVIYESLSPEPDAKPQKRGEFSSLIINLDTGWKRFRYTEPSQ